MPDSHAGRTCPYDQAVIKPGQDVVVCSRCGVAHHKECWEANDGCTTVGCSGTPQAAGAGNGSHGATKVCPYCAEEIQAAAKFCKYCRQWLPGWSRETAAGLGEKASVAGDAQVERRSWTRRVLLTLVAIGVGLAMLPVARIHWSVGLYWPGMMPLAVVAYLGAFCGPRWAAVVGLLLAWTVAVEGILSLVHGGVPFGYEHEPTGWLGRAVFVAAVCLTGAMAGILAGRRRWYLGLLAFPVVAGGFIGLPYVGLHLGRQVVFWRYGPLAYAFMFASAVCALMYVTGALAARWLRGVEKW